MNNTDLLEAAKEPTPQFLQSLLDRYQGEIDEYTRQQLLVVAAEHGRVANLKLLMESRKMHIDSEDELYLLEVAFRAAVKRNQVEAGKFLAERYEEFSSAAMMDVDNSNHFIAEAVRSATVPMLQLLIEERLLDTEDDNMIFLAAQRDNPEVFELFLETEDRMSRYLGLFVTSDSPELVKLALRDRELTKEDLAEAAREYTGTHWKETGRRGIELLLSDRRASTATYVIIYEAVRSDESEVSEDIIQFISRSPLLDMESLLSLAKRRIIEVVGNPTEIPDEIIEKMINSTTFQEDHLELLLLEVAVRQVIDVAYYLGWLGKKIIGLDGPDRLMMMRAIGSAVDNEPTLHSSDTFTVYVAFFLFCLRRTRTKENALAVLSGLRREEGVTEQGIRLAAVLLNALLVEAD